MRSDKCSEKCSGEPSTVLSRFSTVLSAPVNITGLIPSSIHSSFKEAKDSFEYVSAGQLTLTDSLNRRRLSVREVAH